MVEKIKNAVLEATGISFEEFTSPGKKRERYFARLIFSYLCMKLTKMDYREISVIVNRNPSTVFRYWGFYKTEVNVNSSFKKIAEQVERELN